MQSWHHYGQARPLSGSMKTCRMGLPDVLEWLLHELFANENLRPRARSLQLEKLMMLNPHPLRQENTPARKSPVLLEPGRRIQMAWTWAPPAWMPEGDSAQRGARKFGIRRDRWSWFR